MAFTLKIDTNNAAFHGDGGPQPAPEIARILRLIADSLTLSDIPLDGYEKHLIRDYNGNTVGHWEYTSEYPQWECPRCHAINAEVDAQPGDLTCVDCHLTVTANEVGA